MMWFTADTHFGHENILRLANRPWSSVAQMNSAIIANINDRVSATDSLYILGDFAFRCSQDEALVLRRRINCHHVHLVRGNHDRRWSDAGEPYDAAFESEQDYLEIKPGYAKGRKLVLFHYPMLSWNGKWRASIHLHGHIHSQGAGYNERNRDRGVLRYDVGVDANGYCPVSRDDILDFFDGVEPNPSDADSKPGGEPASRA